MPTRPLASRDSDPVSLHHSAHEEGLKKLEEMIKNKIGEAASTNGNNDVDTRASDITSLLAEDRILNSRQQ